MPADAAHGKTGYCLRPPEAEDEWRAYHGIRRRVFNLPRPELEPSSESHPLVLFCGQVPIGAVQIDRLDDVKAALRLVAIDPACQGNGHGRLMLRKAEAFVRNMGCSHAVVYATPEAAGFYADSGYDEDDWDPVCMGGIVQMQKAVG